MTAGRPSRHQAEKQPDQRNAADATEMRTNQILWKLLLATLAVSFEAAAPSAYAQEPNPVADRLAIAEVIAQYAYHWDAKNAEGFADLFTEDAVVERSEADKLIPDSRLEGRQAIFDYASDAHQGRLADRQTRHHMSALVFIELTERSAVTENMVLITHQSEADAVPHISASGIYRNTWRKTEQGWKIARRILSLDGAR